MFIVFTKVPEPSGADRSQSLAWGPFPAEGTIRNRSQALVLKTYDLHLSPRRLDSPLAPYLFIISEELLLNLGVFPRLRRRLNYPRFIEEGSGNHWDPETC